MANPSSSPPGSPLRGSNSSSRSNSASGNAQLHAPATPSGLRNSQVASRSDESLRSAKGKGDSDGDSSSTPLLPALDQDGVHPSNAGQADPQPDEEDTHVQGTTDVDALPSARTRLLDQRNKNYGGTGTGTDGQNERRSPLRRPATFRSMESFASIVPFSHKLFPGLLSRRDTSGVDDPLVQSEMDMTSLLAARHGITDKRKMYLMYYFPFTNWIRQYRLSYVKGDLVAAFTMASFYIPMCLSYASNLGHVPPINGMYSFAVNPVVYALLGTCPQMVVGPEAAGSLLLGQVVRENINNGKHKDQDMTKNAEIAGMVTGLAGAVILLAGLCRLGFLDSVLSRPFLRGFISAIGIVIFIDQLIPEMGLDNAAIHVGGAVHGSSLEKIMFLFQNGGNAHALTCAVSFGAFAVVMVCRELKKRLQPRMSWVAYIPDRFIVVVLSAVLTWKYAWGEQGLDILGDIRAKGKPFQVHFPFEPRMLEHATDAFSTSILIALLGFFESSVAAKSLGVNPQQPPKKHHKKHDGDDDEEEEVPEVPEGISSMIVSPNRELVALGCANILGSLFMTLPAFGGYGRSKVNASTGGKTPMSSVFLSLITVICILFLLPYFYYIPKGVLCAMISVVAYSLIEEAPHDIMFFWRISGYNELLLMGLIFVTTFFWNLRIGIFVGISLSLLRLLRHSTRPRIQILGRIPGSKTFENAELHAIAPHPQQASSSNNNGSPGGGGGQGNQLEFVENTLIIKIPEPLTFANTGHLKHRLRRIEQHGTLAAHPALPTVRPSERDKVVIFDVHGVTTLDPAAAQVLLEIVTAYRDRGVRLFFARVPRSRSGGSGEVWRLMTVSGIVEVCGGEGRFVDSVAEALERSEGERKRLDGRESAVVDSMDAEVRDDEGATRDVEAGR